MAVAKFQGHRLRALRSERNLSQGELGRRIGAHTTSVSDWERGDNSPSGRHVFSLARELGVPVEHFYAEDEDAEAASMSAATADFVTRLDALLTERAFAKVDEAIAVRAKGVFRG